jgi:hypothetical protein
MSVKGKKTTVSIDDANKTPLKRACEGKTKRHGGLNVPGLRKLAVELKITGARTMNRPELLDRLCVPEFMNRSHKGVGGGPNPPLQTGNGLDPSTRARLKLACEENKNRFAGGLNVVDLKKIAKLLNHSGYSKLKREQLLKLLCSSGKSDPSNVALYIKKLIDKQGIKQKPSHSADRDKRWAIPAKLKNNFYVYAQGSGDTEVERTWFLEPDDTVYASYFISNHEIVTELIKFKDRNKRKYQFLHIYPERGLTRDVVYTGTKEDFFEHEFQTYMIYYSMSKYIGAQIRQNRLIRYKYKNNKMPI